MKSSLFYIAAGLVVGALLGYASFAYSAKEPATPEATPINHAAHAMKEIDTQKPIPTIAIEAIKDPKDGYNIHLMTTNYRFTPEASGGTAVEGTGHAHIYVNGTKLGRVYGAWYHVPADKLSPGKNEIEVTLNADDHSEWTLRGEHIAAQTTVTK